MGKKSKFLSIALAITLVIGSLSVPVFAHPTKGQPQSMDNPLDKKVINKIDADNIYNTIDYLQQTPRVASTPEEYAAVQYVKGQFESYGYDVEVQEFEYFGYTAPHTIELTINGESLNPLPFTYTPSGDVQAPLQYVGQGTEAELEGEDLTGKIALVQRGTNSFAEKVINVAEKGAIGIIIFNNAAGAINGTLGAVDDRYVPAVSITQAQGSELVTKLHNGETVTASLRVLGADAGLRTSHNVIASKKPTNKKKDTGKVITLTSHHDSVPGAPGANDNASGTAMVLELARVFKNLPTDTEIRFITFGAEELGLIGSSHYVSNLPEGDLDRIVANFNLDMVGSRDAGELVINTVDGQPNLVTELSQASSLRLNGEPSRLGRSGSSDHVPFAEAGIPAALFIHSPLEPWYHTPEDTIDKISKEKLQDVAEIVGTAIYDFARFDNQTPKQPQKHNKIKLPKQMYFEESIQ
ncbi:M28 family peptidase [Ornithinibacillus scapharcae]|uniref:M28 family peptidase n=1 Tax=Ornithinibacillus scapharcae TaxID=1147159 RepID=UPI000225B047|nr:M28 family peptidase [Ornithinibacillus scapharcae]